METNTAIQPDIFEAIRQLHPYHHMLALKDVRKIEYKIPMPFVEILRYDNGRRIGLPYSFDASYYENKYANALKQGHLSDFSYPEDYLKQVIRRQFPGLYRGEYRYHSTTLPSGKRDISESTKIPVPTQDLIDKLKIEEFIQISKTFPNTILAQCGNIDIKWQALAQHYGLRTNLLDVTTEPFIAAFFATHRYDSEKEQYKMVTKGIGCLKKAHPTEFLLPNNKAVINAMVGVQHFGRPALQRAFCWDEDALYPMLHTDGCSSVDETSGFHPIMNGNNVLHELRLDSAKLNWQVVMFRQTRTMSRKIHELFFHGDECLLFPDEVIAKAAKAVDKRKATTIDAVYAVSRQLNIPPNDIISELKSVGYPILFNPAFVLSEKEFQNICSDIKRRGLYHNVHTFERKMMLGDEDGMLFEPDDSYSTYDASIAPLILALFVFGGEAFNLS